MRPRNINSGSCTLISLYGHRKQYAFFNPQNKLILLFNKQVDILIGSHVTSDPTVKNPDPCASLSLVYNQPTTL